MQNTGPHLTGSDHRKRPSSEFEEPLSGPPCKRFQSTLRIDHPSELLDHQDDHVKEYAVINEVLKRAHFNSLAMRANTTCHAKR